MKWRVQTLFPEQKNKGNLVFQIGIHISLYVFFKTFHLTWLHVWLLQIALIAA
jgi:hypothetical protein